MFIGDTQFEAWKDCSLCDTYVSVRLAWVGGNIEPTKRFGRLALFAVAYFWWANSGYMPLGRLEYFIIDASLGCHVRCGSWLETQSGCNIARVLTRAAKTGSGWNCSHLVK